MEYYSHHLNSQFRLLTCKLKQCFRNTIIRRKFGSKLMKKMQKVNWMSNETNRNCHVTTLHPQWGVNHPRNSTRTNFMSLATMNNVTLTDSTLWNFTIALLWSSFTPLVYTNRPSQISLNTEILISCVSVDIHWNPKQWIPFRISLLNT